jgi:hypothetical protein
VTTANPLPRSLRTEDPDEFNRCPYRLPCTPLLADPLLLLDPQRPRHICYNTMRASTADWTTLEPIPAVGDWRVWQELELGWLCNWPLPIGQQVIHPLVWSRAVTTGGGARGPGPQVQCGRGRRRPFRPGQAGPPGLETAGASGLAGRPRNRLGHPGRRPPPRAERLIRAAWAW